MLFADSFFTMDYHLLRSRQYNARNLFNALTANTSSLVRNARKKEERGEGGEVGGRWEGGGCHDYCNRTTAAFCDRDRVGKRQHLTLKMSAWKFVSWSETSSLIRVIDGNYNSWENFKQLICKMKCLLGVNLSKWQASILVNKTETFLKEIRSWMGEKKTKEQKTEKWEMKKQWM